MSYPVGAALGVGFAAAGAVVVPSTPTTATRTVPATAKGWCGTIRILSTASDMCAAETERGRGISEHRFRVAISSVIADCPLTINHDVGVSRGPPPKGWSLVISGAPGYPGLTCDQVDTRSCLRPVGRGLPAAH